MNNQHKQKMSSKERMERYGIEITIKDIYATHVKHRRDKKEIVITHIGGRTSGIWTSFDFKRIIELWNDFLECKDFTFKIEENESDGLKRLKEERKADTEETLNLWHDKQRGKEWLEFQEKNR